MGAIEYGIALMRAGETVYAPRMGLLFVCQVKSDFTHHIVLHTPECYPRLPSVTSCCLFWGVGWGGMLRSCVLMQTTTTLSVCTRASLLMLTVAMALEKVAGSYGRITRNDLSCCLFVTLLGRSLNSIRSILTTALFFSTSAVSLQLHFLLVPSATQHLSCLSASSLAHHAITASALPKEPHRNPKHQIDRLTSHQKPPA